MTNTFKTMAIAALMGTVSAPAFAEAHMSATMTCAEYKELSAEDQMTVMAMAIGEVEAGMDGESLEGSAAATTTDTDVPAAEATDAESTEGSIIAGEAKAVEPTGGNTEASNVTAEPMDTAAMEQFMVICDQNPTALVSEAAVGMVNSR